MSEGEKPSNLEQEGETPLASSGAEPVRSSESTIQVLDPFGFHGHWRSRFENLGGDEPPGDPNYVFHTEYVKFPLGSARFIVRFSNLRATVGSITFVVHAFDGQQMVIRNYEATVALCELVERDGCITFGVADVPGCTHALLAHSYGEMDGACRGISVQVVHEQPVVLPPAKAALRQHPSATTTQLVSLQHPSFVAPVSQPCTGAQLDEISKTMIGQLRSRDEPGPLLWRHLMPRHILEHYGALRGDACLLQLGPDEFGVVDAVRAAAGEVVEIASGSRTSLIGGTANGSKISAEAVFLPTDFHNHFDMVVSGIEPADFGSQAIWSRFVMDSALCLRPGGLAVYTCRAALLSERQCDPHTLALSRLDLERLCVKLVSRKLDIAELRYGSREGADAPLEISAGAAPFVLVVSRSIA